MRQFAAIALSSALVLQATPLWAAPGAARSARAGGVQAAVIDGTILSATGQAMPNSLQLRDLDTGQVAGTTTSNAQGAFSFGPRRPGSYSVELVNPAGTIVGSSAAIATSAGASARVTLGDSRAAIQSAREEAAARIAEAEAAARVRAAAILARIRALLDRIRNPPSPSL
jgi:hypothetical protein